MPIVHLRFYAGLSYFLPPLHRQRRFDHALEGRTAVKDVIEAAGVPHPEVDLILVDGDAVGFEHGVTGGEMISVYPPFTTLDCGGLGSLRPPITGPKRFVLDVHLGRLTAALRTLGFDSLFPSNMADEYLAAQSAHENRILLTRDRGLLKRSIVTYGYYVRATEPKAQIIEVVRRFKLLAELAPFSRCARCNGLLRDVAKDTILDRLQPDTRRYYDQFRLCEDCHQLYWQGSHFKRMQQFVAEIVTEAQAMSRRTDAE